MRAIETAAIGSGAVTGLELMERAGCGVVAAMFREWPALAKTDHRALVLCGPGNNGGDGFVVARLLRDWGWAVDVHLFGAPDRLPPDARCNYDRWCAMGPVHDLETTLATGLSAARFDVFVDAVFGTGLKRGLSLPLSLIGAVRTVDGRRDAAPPCKVAIDIPSGLESDSGRLLGAAENIAVADLTVTFHSAKIGQFLHDGPKICGKLVVEDIGLSSWSQILPPEAPEIAGICQLADGATLSRPLQKQVAGHKFEYGHALILSGGPGRGGAARLAARGALRVGAGLVTVACPPDALAEMAAQLNAIMLHPVADADALARVLEDTRINALCLGPGLGLSNESRNLVAEVLKSHRATVLDADALTLIARDATLFVALHDKCIVTPHAGEFARLFPEIAANLAALPTNGPACSKLDATRAAAAMAGCVVLYKGPDTVIAAPDGRCIINSAHYGRAAPWLATAGAGDVLAGMIAGLLARGFAPMFAAQTAAWLHVEAARKFGPGLIAEDIPEMLPAVFKGLGV